MWRGGCCCKILTTFAATSNGEDYLKSRVLLFLRGQCVETAQLTVNLDFGVGIFIEELVVGLVCHHSHLNKDPYVYSAIRFHPLRSSEEVTREFPNKSELTVRKHRKHGRCDQSSGTTVAVDDRFSSSGSKRHSRTMYRAVHPLVSSSSKGV